MHKNLFLELLVRYCGQLDCRRDEPLLELIDGDLAVPGLVQRLHQRIELGRQVGRRAG
jgi:hypothetical protein